MRTLLNRAIIRYAFLLEWTPFKGLHLYTYEGRLYVSSSKPREVDLYE